MQEKALFSNDDQENIGRNKDVPIHDAVFSQADQEDDELKPEEDHVRQL